MNTMSANNAVLPTLSVQNDNSAGLAIARSGRWEDRLNDVDVT